MYYICNVNQGARQRSHGKGNKYPSHNQVKSSTMTQKEKVEAFIELKKATEEALLKVQEVANEYYDLVADLRKAVDASEERNIVGAFDLNLQFECILYTRYELEAVQRVLKRCDRDMDFTERDAKLVSWKTRAYVQKAEIELAKIKAIASLVGITHPQIKQQ